MSAFIGNLVTERVALTDNDEYWKLVDDFGYQSDIAGITITVPAGFMTDFASVPRYPVAYWLAGGCAQAASVIHDYLYTTHIVDRKTADAVLKEASLVTGVPPWRADIMWLGVRLGGGSHWTPTQQKVDVQPDHIPTAEPQKP